MIIFILRFYILPITLPNFWLNLLVIQLKLKAIHLLPSNVYNTDTFILKFEILKLATRPTTFYSQMKKIDQKY